MIGEEGRFDRRAVVAALLRDRGETLVVTGLGAPAYDVAACGDHPRNFYLWGAMGGAVSVGLGLALAQPDVPVAVITGDGEMLMGLGSLASVAVAAPRNLSIVVLDNGRYGETGGQATHTDGVTDLVAVAKGCGIADGYDVVDEAAVSACRARLTEVGFAPAFYRIAIERRERERVLPPRDGGFLKNRMRGALGLGSL